MAKVISGESSQLQRASHMFAKSDNEVLEKKMYLPEHPSKNTIKVLP